MRAFSFDLIIYKGSSAFWKSNPSDQEIYELVEECLYSNDLYDDITELSYIEKEEDYYHYKILLHEGYDNFWRSNPTIDDVYYLIEGCLDNYGFDNFELELSGFMEGEPLWH